MQLSNLVMRVLIALAFLLSVNADLYAGVYKYQDKAGRWHYTDSSVNSKSIPATISGPAVKVRLVKGGPRDFVTSLSQKYKPVNAIEKATLAVVMVKTHLGLGSGFFISEDCYLITNKHVIRPASGKNWARKQLMIKRNSQALLSIEEKIATERMRLRLNEVELAEFKSGFSDSELIDKQSLIYQKLLNYQLRQSKDKAQLKKVTQDFKKQQRAFSRQKNDFNYLSSMATRAESFDIFLKDNTKTKARLIRISEKEDLALLKVEACRSPYLNLASLDEVRQGMVVYAIGSPLGMRDQLTKGTVSNVSPMGIVTDAQILPGNSGGPLILETGEVIAVNTLKVSPGSVMGRGFGISIPVNRVKAYFADELK